MAYETARGVMVSPTRLEQIKTDARTVRERPQTEIEAPNVSVVHGFAPSIEDVRIPDIGGNEETPAKQTKKRKSGTPLAEHTSVRIGKSTTVAKGKSNKTEEDVDDSDQMI